MLRVSFYSYKGGAGRSTTSWNTIERLVNLMKPTAKEPFVIVDTDTESAGSTFLYKADGVFYKNKDYASVQKRMTDSEDVDYDEADDSDKETFFKGMYPIGTFFGLPEAEEKSVLLIGANLHKNSAKDAKVSGDEEDRVEDGIQMENFHRNITLACRRCGAKALFFDSPSGTQFLARKSIWESEIIVCCMRPTSQFRVGTRGQLINFIRTDLEKNKAGKRKYILTPTTVCTDDGQVFVLNGIRNVYPEEAKKIIEREFGTEEMRENEEIKQAFKDNVILDMLGPTPVAVAKEIYPESEDKESVFGIPEIKRFKWFEACLGKLDELSDNDKMGVNRYEFLARTILKHSRDGQKGEE